MIGDAQIWSSYAEIRGQATQRGVTYVCYLQGERWTLTEAQVRGYRVPIIGLRPPKKIEAALNDGLKRFLKRGAEEQDRGVIIKETIHGQPKAEG